MGRLIPEGAFPYGDHNHVAADSISPQQALLATQRAFDGVARDYDGSNAANLLLCAMRERTRETIETLVAPGSRVLDLGCGPGCDDEYLARRGYVITAIDWSAAMVLQTRQRIEDSRLGDRVAVHHLGIHEVDALAPATFDAAYSSFGPLNCVPDPIAAARLIANRLKPGGVLVASVIGRTCPWEVVLYAMRGDWRRATIRYARELVPVPLEGGTVWTRYYSTAEFERIFGSAGFTRISLRALGLFSPPPYLDAFAARHPALVAALQRTDDIAGTWPPFRSWGDHFLIALRKA